MSQDKGIAEKQTYITFYLWHPDGTKTFIKRIPNKLKRSKHLDQKKSGIAPDL